MSSLPVSATPAAAVAPVLRTCGLSRRYGQHLALADISLDVHAGEVHVLFGENGAGKSTLIALLAGAGQPTTGTLQVAGYTGSFASVAQARAHGVRAVFQEFSLVPTLSVAQNITLGEEPVRGGVFLDSAASRAEAGALVQQLGFALDLDALVGQLPRGKQQMVEICKALRHPPRVLILDEPTASLSEHDTRALFDLVRRLKGQGTAVIYITHRMHEIAALGDRVTVLRDGRQVATVPADTPAQRLIELMTGRALSQVYPVPGPVSARVRLSLDGVAVAPQAGSVGVHPTRLQVRAGEIVGIAGLVGCGKSELAQACFGLRRLAEGRMVLDARPVHLGHPADAIAAGVWYCPSDRKREGLALGLSAAENMGLSGLRHGPLRGHWRKPRRARAHLGELARRVEFPADRLDEPMANFSGGNQQKVLLAKGLAQDIGVYVLDEPTVGVDVGARQAIYRCLADLSARGAAILLVSSDLSELMGLTHRLLVMKDGRITGEFERSAYDEHRILSCFF